VYSLCGGCSGSAPPLLRRVVREEVFMSTPVYEEHGALRQWLVAGPSHQNRSSRIEPTSRASHENVPSGPSLATLERERERARRRVLEEQIASLFQRREAIRQEERQRIARDVHDHLGQQMTALRMQLEALYTECASQPAMLDHIARTQRIAQALDRDLDGLIAQLRPAPLPERDFAVALSALVEGWSERFGVAAECAVSTEAARRLARNAVPNLYAITQEALHNVIKHARATCVNVSLNRQDDRAVLLIEDDGRGFQKSRKRPTRRGYGLVTMRERAELAGGDFEIESSPRRGTTIYIRVPLDCSNAAAASLT
jgi:two-component system, chemotaxis family, sensor kinase Cph1